MNYLKFALFMKLGQFKSLKFGSDYEKNKYLNDLLSLYDQWAEIFPERKLGYLCKGLALGFAGKRSKREAVKNFTIAIEKDSEFYEAYF